MGKYYHLFDTQADYQAARNDRYSYREPWLGYCKETGKMSYDKVWPESAANCYEYIDMGLPSGNLWATKNIGASSISDQGSTFEWGGIVPKTTYNSWTGYRFGGSGATANTLTKYNSTDGKTTLDLEDDAARVRMGGSWTIPTSNECSELLRNSTGSVVTIDNIKMHCLESKINGNKLYFPPYPSNNNIFMVWSSSRHPSSPGLGYKLCRYSESNKYYYGIETANRYLIYSIRGIIRPNLQ